MLPRTLPRLITALVVAFLGVALVVPAAPAQAHDTQPPQPPFEVSFPQDPTKTTFSNDWGQLRSGGRRHRGNDLMATSKMVEVYAFADGVVTHVDERPRPGRYVSIDHDEGWSSLYVHLNDDNPGTDDGEAPWSLTLAPGIEEGAEVKAGQLIGWVGDSGNAEGNKPHLHFELSVDGVEINPFLILVDAFERDLKLAEFKEWVVGAGDEGYEIV